MSCSCKSSTDSVPLCKSSCNSHVSVYYEQNQVEDEASEPNCIHDQFSVANISKCPVVEIHEEETTCIDLPPLIWHGYDCCPKFLTVTNTGRTISIKGNWTKSRPYIEGGPLNGTYLFSQIHFHCPSEHEIDGRRYPLEMHIVHYKTSYLTQERAMQEKDGTVVLVYLFQLMKTGQTVISQITKLAPELMEANRPMESCEIPLRQLIKPFMSNYYVYWGSIAAKHNCYLLQWIVNCNLLKVTKQEVEDLSNIITCAVGVKVMKTPQVKPDYGAIFHVGEADYSLPPLKTVSCHDICSVCRPGQSVSLVSCGCQSKISLSKSNSGRRIGTIGSKCSKCSKCKLRNITRDTRCAARKGLVIVKKISVKKSKKKKMKRGCAQKSKEKSDSESLLSCICDINKKKIKKSKRKKLLLKLKSLYDSGSEKSSSKSSVCSEKLKVKVDIVSENCDSEIDKPIKKKNAKEKCETKIIEKGKRKTKEVKVVQSAYSVKDGPSKSSLKTSADPSFLGMNASGVNLFDPNSSANDNDKTQEEGNKKESLEIIKVKANGEIAKKCSSSVLKKESGSNLDEGKKEIISSQDINSKSSVISRVFKSRSKSPTNAQKPKDPENSEGKANNRGSSQSKSKSPAVDILKRKISLRKNRERSNTNSKTKMRSDSKSKLPRGKKVAESAKSAQEVKFTAAKSKTQIDNLKCDTTLSADLKTKNNKGSSKITRSKSKETVKGKKNKADGEGPKGKEDDEIKTIFQKKKNGKKVQPLTGDCNDVNVNFLLTSDDPVIPSNAQTTSESDFNEEKKLYEDINEKRGPFDETFTINTATILESEFPGCQVKENSQGCFLMEHIFRTEYKEKACDCSSQEYQLTIIYDQCILQEYRGKFHPQELQIGDCKMLTLFPKFPERKITSFRLRDCSIKKESLDEICIRVKFMLQDLNVFHIFSNTENKLNGTPEKKDTLLFDQQIQCNPKELNFIESYELKSIEESKNYKKIKDCETNENLLSELTSGNKEEHGDKLENNEKQKSESKIKERQKLPSESEEKQQSKSKIKERQKLPSESEEKQQSESKIKEMQKLGSENEEKQKLESKREDNQRLRSKSKENRKMGSESEDNHKMSSKIKEKQKQQSESDDHEKMQSKGKVNQKMQTESEEKQKLQSESEKKENLQSKRKERQNLRLKSKKDQRMRPGSEEKQKMPSECEEIQRPQSEIEEKRERQLETKKNQKIQSESEEKQKPQLNRKDNQKLQSKNKKNQKSRSQNEEKQKLQSESEDIKEIQPKGEEMQKLQSEIVEKQKIQSESEEKQKLQSETEEKQNLQSKRNDNKKLISKTKKKQKSWSETEENHALQSEIEENHRLPSENEENHILQSEFEDNHKLQSENEENHILQSEIEENHRLPSENEENHILQSEIEENHKLQSENEENHILQSEIEENHKLQFENEENHILQSEIEENHKLQFENEENHILQSEIEDNHRLPSESEGNHEQQLENEEKHKLQSEIEENRKQQSEIEEKRKQQLENEEKHKQQLENEEKHKLQLESEGDHEQQSEIEGNHEQQSEIEGNHEQQSEIEENRKQQSEIEENDKQQLENEEKHKLQSEIEENRKQQSQIEEKRKQQLENEEKHKLQSESEEKPEEEKNEWIHWEKEITEPQKSGVKPERDTNVCSEDASRSCAIEQISLESESERKNKVESLCSEKSEKKLKPLFVKRRKTVYFMYDKVEKDKNTGKKVFVGSFKTKEEVESLKKQKALPQENEEVGEKSGKTSEVKRKIENLEKPSNVKSSLSDKNSPSISEDASNKKLDIIILHKYKPKHSESNGLEKDCKNELIEKAMDNSQENRKSSTKMGRITRVFKKRASRAFIYKPKEPSESESQENPVPDGGETEAMNVDVLNGRDDHSLSEVSSQEDSTVL